MRPSTVAVAIAFLAGDVCAHWYFSGLIVNGSVTKEWQYMRDVSPSTTNGGVFGKVSPQIGDDIYDTDITCGRNAFASAPNTGVADVLAGDEIGFKVNGTAQIIFHYGPSQLYLAKVPEGKSVKKVSGYEDEMKWFKVGSLAQKNDTSWTTNLWTEVNFTLPRTTPPGEYLARVEAFWPMSSVTSSQWYVNCAQINVIGPGGGKPTAFAKFPGTYEVADPGIWITAEQDNSPPKGLSKYVAPGPKVWTG